MLLRIDHETRLTYSEPVTESVIKVRMAPLSGDDQTVMHYRLRLTPPAPVTSFRDGFGNRVDLFNILPPHGDLAIAATSFVQTHRRPGRDRIGNVMCPVDGQVDLDAVEFTRPSKLVGAGPAVRAFVSGLPRHPATVIERVQELVAAVRGRMIYEKKVTTANTPVAEALELGRGVCQDFAHLLIAACRAVGLPARYVSGYVCQPGEVATHAWVQVWAGPGCGWVDIDPTHDTWPGDDHVVTAVGRDYADVPPNRGVWKGAATETIAVTVSVRPLDRLPPEAGEPIGAPAWVGTALPQPTSKSRFPQQNPSRVIRQQQSQQQQSQ
jgi:transglutaminase-like putative cysteine protease